MKSAYELAMERLEQTSGKTRELSKDEKARISELEAKAKSDIAQEEIMATQKTETAMAAGDIGTVQEIQVQFRVTTGKIQAQLDKDKAAIHSN